MPDTITPPHPGLDRLANTDELKKLCPAFQNGCPYAKMNVVDSLAVTHGEISKCPAFKEGCPFSSKSPEEMAQLISLIPQDHPVLDTTKLPPCNEGIELVKVLNSFLKSQGREQKEEDEILEDPQLAMAMREGTKVIHRAAETSVFTRRFMKGDITADEYGLYINSLYFVYKYMEELLEQYKEHPVVKLIYFPHELNRQESLKQDMAYFYGEEAVPRLVDPATMPSSVKKYVETMKEACLKNPALLIAHSYTRYLGDLSGGQMLAKRLKKSVLKLEEGDSSWDTTIGLNFYMFNTLGNHTDFKNFYRERLNAAKVDKKTRDLIVAESVVSFELNIGLFDQIQEYSDAGKLVPTVLNKEEVEEEIEIIEVTRDSPRKEVKSAVNWLAAVGALTSVVVVGAVVYQRYYVKRG
ncbi:heme oxygenase-domain-containing protein [Pilobolus umbonatus]|nr:heme oxygenase-domain-containing protein [Pilobolus umbonatus]